MAKFWKEGLSFSCHQCGNCCTFQGGAIYASEAEFQAIANQLSITLEEFLEKYTVEMGSLVSIKSISSGPCIFYDKGCSIYSNRPKQCRTYPFWPEILKNSTRWEKEAKSCKGIGRGSFHSFEEIREILLNNDSDLMISPKKEN